MIDTQVLSYALATEPAKDEKTRRLQRDSAALVATLAEVRVSALTVLELLRAPPHVVAKVQASGILEQLQVEAWTEGSRGRLLASSKRRAATVRHASVASTSRARRRAPSAGSSSAISKRRRMR
jgi:hypothetical protein